MACVVVPPCVLTLWRVAKPFVAFGAFSLFLEIGAGVEKIIPVATEEID